MKNNVHISHIKKENEKWHLGNKKNWQRFKKEKRRYELVYSVINYL